MSAFTFSAPYLSKEQEQEEWEGLSTDERTQIKNDVFGSAVPIRPTREMRVYGVDQLRNAIARMPDSEKCDYVEATRRAPELVESESNPTSFLRCERYDSQAAAKRLVTYWKLRKATFGAEKAFLPMTLTGAMADYVEHLEKGHVTMLPDDEHGRAVIFFDRIRAVRSVITREQVCCCFFYLIQVLLERASARENGFVVVMNLKGYDLYKHFDRPMMKKIVAMILNAPVKWNATHFCTGSGKSVVGLIMPVLKYMAGKYYRLRIVIHSGSNSELLVGMERYGMVKNNMSYVVGGYFQHEDFLGWMRERREFEDRQEFEQPIPDGDEESDDQ